jgi:hypothetical protein
MYLNETAGGVKRCGQQIRGRVTGHSEVILIPVAGKSGSREVGPAGLVPG